ncbi:MAG: hypothetical protein LBD98_02095 [Endomicrobium sp.]|jgi:hypothetical protein|nr:hypothetical protein [Endomicrobium sp.]
MYVFSKLDRLCKSFNYREATRFFIQGDISPITLECAIFKNIALAIGYDRLRGIFTIKEAISSGNISGNIIEGFAYLSKGYELTKEHNLFIGMSKLLALSYADKVSLPKLIEPLVDISPLYHTNKDIFYKFKGSIKIIEGSVTLMSFARLITYSGGLLSAPTIPIVILVSVSFIFCYSMLFEVPKSVNSDDPIIMTTISSNRKSLALEFFETATSNFYEAEEYYSEENGKKKQYLHIGTHLSTIRSVVQRWKIQKRISNHFVNLWDAHA